MHCVAFLDRDDEPEFSWQKELTKIADRFEHFNYSVHFLYTCDDEVKERLNLDMPFPQFHIFHPHKHEPEIVLTSSPFTLSDCIMAHNRYYKRGFDSDKEDKFKGIEKLLSVAKVILIMKGSPSFPRCSHSEEIVQCLNSHSINYQSLDILRLGHLRGWLTVYSGCRSFPQLFVNTKFVADSLSIKKFASQGKLSIILPNDYTFEGTRNMVEELKQKYRFIVFDSVSN